MRGDHRSAIVAIHAALIAALVCLQVVVPPFHHMLLARIMVLAAYAIGYNLLLGYTGLMSLGHAMFFAAGMYGAGLPLFYLGVGAPEALLLGIAASLVLAVVIGALTLRTSGASFLIVTLMFAQVFYLSTLYFNRITLGDQGFVLAGHLPPISLGALRVTLSEPVVRYNLALATFAVCLGISLWLVGSPIGRVLVAIRENEDRTRMLGYNTFAYKLLALTISAAIAGFSGSVYAVITSYVGASFAAILYSIYPLVWTLLGGSGTALGPFVGTAVMTYTIETASRFTSSYLIVVGVILVALVMRFPSGIVGALRQRWVPWLP
ncbi:MAG TPA: branched-chain amino acid ABC transporter permease [bacterium]|nr:branched-chain amino acid ABC transporter permease [bacterium]